MASTKYLPEARRGILEMMDLATAAWLESMLQESFTDPDDDENIEIMLEAVASAVAKMMEQSQHKDALLRTFALNILDQVSDQQGE